MKSKQILIILLTLCMLFSFSFSFSTFAEEITPAENAIIYLTVNNQGKLATDNNGMVMANREVTVTDINSDGKLTCDEALITAHKTYNTEDGYIGGSYVTKLWGVETSNTLFFINNVGLANGVGTDTIASGDKLTASINKDNITWADWYTFFDVTERTIKTNESITLTLKGHLGMAWDDADKVDVPLPDISIGTWNDGVFTQIEDKKTNENGNVILSFDETGTYYITAQGTVKDMVIDWSNGGVEKEADCPIIAPACVLTVTENGGTEEPPPSTDDEDTENPDTPTDNEKKDYNIVIPDALEKIADTYKDKTDEWTVMDMGAYESYAPQTANKLTTDAKQEFINSAISSVNNPEATVAEISKAILALASIKKNPEMLYTVNSNTPVSAIEKLKNIDGNTIIYTAPHVLAAYNQGDYNTQANEDNIIAAVLSGLKNNSSVMNDIDTISNVLAALSFYKHRQDVSLVSQEIIEHLSSMQDDNGAFSENSNSTAMAIIGLCAAGVDLVNDPRFIKNENTAIDGLLTFLNEYNDGFVWKHDSGTNSLATEQSFRALIAFMQRVKKGEAYNIYDFSKNEFTPARATGNNSSSSAPSEPSGENITVTMTIKADTGYWLNNYSTTIPGEGATVYHAFVKACSANSITHQGAAKGYVSSITKGNNTLAEFDQGVNSGWLYKINGELPTVGFTDCAISDGDNIVWYYTEDWTKDPSAGHYGGSPSVSNKTENNSVVAKTNVSGKKATLTATESSIKKAISNAEKNNNSSIVISSSDTKNATNITLEIPANSVKDIADSKGLSLLVETAAGNVDISSEALNAISAQIGDKPLNVVIETKLADEIKESTDVISKDELQNAIIVDVEITSGDTKISTFGGHILSVAVPVDGKKHEKGKTYKIHIISADGSVETTYGECVEKNGQLYVSVQTKHLSSFVVTDIEKNSFTDTVAHWASDAIEYVYNHSIMEGIGDSVFAPDNTMTRAMLVTVLYRLENPTEKAKSHSFADVKDGEWYADAVSWASENGIVEGISETEFAPNVDITREQMAAVLYRYAQYKEQDTSIGEDTNILSYTDAIKISEYAIPAMQWMLGAGLMKGETESTINPRNNSTRAQVATILMRYLQQ